MFVGLGVVIVVVALGAAREIEYRGAAKPGVRILGTDVGGKSRAQIEAVVRRWVATSVTIRAPGHAYRVRRGWLVSVDVSATASRALAAGSAFSLVTARRIDVTPAIGRAPAAGNVLTALARSGRKPASAQVMVNGTTVAVRRARWGRELDRVALLGALESGASDLRASYVSLRPAISTATARVAAAEARALVASPVSLTYNGARLGALTVPQLARALQVRPQAHAFAVSYDADALARIVRPRLGRWIVRAHNAQFAVSGDNVRVVASRPGLDVDPQQLAASVVAAARSNHTAEVALGPREADLTTAEANALGIRTRLASYTTQMGASSSNRIHNVHLMADFIDGTLIEPGQVFSFNDVVGPRTAERGFLEGQEIIGSLVLPSIGGGVCQTATTLFNDAFETGLPILARVNHNLYLSHYPLGRDATVAWGGPDFRFRNDLKHGILIKTAYTDQTLTFTFYGTPEGRRVVSSTSAQTNWTKPGMNYAVDPRAPRGSVKVVKGTGEQGFDVTVTRTVFDRDGKQLRHDVFRSRYIPDSDTTVYGPGKTPPGPYIVLPSIA